MISFSFMTGPWYISKTYPKIATKWELFFTPGRNVTRQISRGRWWFYNVDVDGTPMTLPHKPQKIENQIEHNQRERATSEKSRSWGRERKGKLLQKIAEHMERQSSRNLPWPTRPTKTHRPEHLAPIPTSNQSLSTLSRSQSRSQTRTQTRTPVLEWWWLLLSLVLNL